MTNEMDAPPPPDPATEPAPASASTAATQPAPEPPPDAAAAAVAAGPVPAFETAPEAGSPPPDAAAVAAVAGVPEPVPTASPPTAGRRNRVLGLAAQVAGVIGIVVCLALVVGMLLGRSWATGTVSELATGVDDKIAQAVPVMDRASAKVSEVSGRVGALADAATAVAALPAPGADLRATLRGALNRVSERYLELRTAYGDVRETAGGALDRLETLDRLIPGFAIPQGPVDALTRLDAGIQELDTKVIGLAEAIPDTGPIALVATAAATRATEAQAKLQSVNDVIDDARTRLAEVRAKVASTADTVNTAITLGTVAMILVLLYFALLHWVLFRTGRRLRRGPPGG